MRPDHRSHASAPAVLAPWTLLLTLALSLAVLSRGELAIAQPPTEAAPPESKSAEEPVASPAESDATTANEEAKSEAPGTRTAIPVPKRTAPEDPIFVMGTAGQSATLEAIADTGVFKLFEEPDMKRVVKTVTERYEKKVAESEELMSIAAELGGDIGLEVRITRAAEKLAEVDFEGFEMYWYPPVEKDSESPQMLGVVVFPDSQQDELLENLKEVLEIFEELDEGESSKREVEGVEIRAIEAAFADEDEDLEFAFFVDAGELWFGLNAADLLDGLAAQKPDASRQSASSTGDLFDRGHVITTFGFDFEAMFDWAREAGEEDFNDNLMKAFTFLGISSLADIRGGAAADGANIREKLQLRVDATGKGLLGALRPIPAEGAGRPPSVPLLDPELLHIRGSFDMDKVLDAIVEMDEQRTEEDPESGSRLNEERLEMTRGILAGFDGGMAMTLAAPSVGGFLPLPRMAFAFGIADADKYATALGEMKKRMEGIGFEDQEYKDTTLTLVRIPNNPSPIVPAFAVVDGTLVIAESPMTLRSLIAEMKDGEGPGRPTSPDDRRDVLTCEYDTRQIFRLLYEKVLPLSQLGMAQLQRMTGSAGEPLLNIAELPKPEFIAQHLGEGTARITWTDGGLDMVASSPLGDPIMAMMASIMTPLVPMTMGPQLDAQRAEWERVVVEARLEKVVEALEVHKATFGSGKRFPATLGELVGRGLVEDESWFLVPSDDDTQSVEYETLDGDIAEVEVSFKYLPNSKLEVPAKELERSAFDFTDGIVRGPDGEIIFELDDMEELEGLVEEAGGEMPGAKTKKILLYELNSNRHDGRFVVTSDGEIYHLSEDRFNEVISLE